MTLNQCINILDVEYIKLCFNIWLLMSLQVIVCVLIFIYTKHMMSHVCLWRTYLDWVQLD